MKMIPIFGKNLFTMKYEGETKDEFARLFELWQDAEYLELFFQKFEYDLKNGFWNGISVEDAILKTFEYAQEFEARLLKLSEKGNVEQVEGLGSIFSLLYNSQYKIKTLDKSKSKQMMA